MIALTGHEAALVADYCPGAAARVRIVGNGIEDIPDSCVEAGVRDGSCRDGSCEAPLVLYTGRFVEHKGITDLLEAIPRVLAQAPNTRFVLAGGHRGCGGDDMAARWLPPQMRAYWSSGRIHFTGWLTPPEIDAWYRRADVLVVPSWYEPFGMVIL